jgi:hypothetical protein
MKLCIFHSETWENGNYRHICRREGCGQVFITTAPRHRAVCIVQPEGASLVDHTANSMRKQVSLPSLARRATSLAVSHSRWIAAGRPMRSTTRISEIFEICQTCEHFRRHAANDEGTCQICGCRLRRMGGLLNKIQMATESCPAMPPKWNAEVAVGA